MSDSRINFKSLLIEAILIVFTISLALAVNEWRMGLATDSLVERVIKTLEDETLTNQKNVTKAIEYHNNLIKELRDGTHVMNKIPLSVLSFNPENDSKLKSFVEASIIDGLGEIHDIQIIRKNGKRYLAISKRLHEIVVKDDTITVYGSGNIRLLTADISNNSWQLANATNALVEMDYELVKRLGEMNTLFDDYKLTSEKAISILYNDNGSIQSVLEDMHWMEQKLLTNYNQILELVSE